MTWPSFFAASISLGVIGSGGGAAAMTRVENAAPASNAPNPLSTVRRDILGFFIGAFHPFVLAGPRLGTPEAIVYSYSSQRVFRRQRVAPAVRLDSQTWQQPVQYRTRPGFGRLRGPGPGLLLR